MAPLADGLGPLEGSACPHYLGEPGRREKYLDWVADGSLRPGYAIDEYAALLFRDGEVVEAVAERPDRPVLRVERDGSGRAVETEIPVRQLLGAGSRSAGQTVSTSPAAKTR